MNTTSYFNQTQIKTVSIFIDLCYPPCFENKPPVLSNNSFNTIRHNGEVRLSTSLKRGNYLLASISFAFPLLIDQVCCAPVALVLSAKTFPGSDDFVISAQT